MIAAAIFFVGRIHPPVLKSPAELIENVHRLIEKNDPAGALKEITTLLEIFPRNHIYLFQAAQLARQLEKYSESAAYLERFLLSSPNPAEACPDIVRAYWNAGDKEKMLDSATRCLRLEPRNSDFELALALERAAKLEAALEQYNLGTTSFPGYGDFAIKN